MNLVACPGCGVRLEQLQGPTHRYIESSPACWAMYGEVLSREYSDREYGRVHRLSVDAYAAQHPGSPSKQSIQSVAIHLMSLCLVLERDVEADRATRAIQHFAKDKERFVWLEPPASRGDIPVLDVHRAPAAAEHCDIVRAWAGSVWAAWTPHHPAIREWASATPECRPGSPLP
jgi:hypothetical protein